MAVAFDAVGPSSAGAGNLNSTSLTWSHTCGGAATVLLVGVALGQNTANDNTYTITATYNGVAMTSVGGPQSSGATGFTGGNGYVQVFRLIGPGTGQAFTVAVNVTGGTPKSLAGGSISFSGAGGTGSPVVGFGSTTPATVTVASNTSGNMIAAFVGTGSGGESSTAPATSRYVIDETGNSGCGNSAGETTPSTGSSLSVGWTTSTDIWGEVALEVTAGALPPPLPVRTPVFPGPVWLRYFRKPQYSNQQPPGPLITVAPPVTATATGTALNPTVITVSAAAVPTFNPGWTWRKHFQWPQQQQLSGPPPLAFGTAQTATATGTAFGTAPSFVHHLAGSGINGYFTDQYGQPKFLQLEMIWGLPCNAGRWNGSGGGTYQQDIDSYFNARGSQGAVTAWWGVPWINAAIDSGAVHLDGRTWDGTYPFKLNGTPGTIATGSETVTLNDPFWQRIDYLIGSAARNGIAVFLNLGMQYDFTDAGAIFVHLSSTQAHAIGAAVATRYPQSSYANVHWAFGDDTYSGSGGAITCDTAFTQMYAGIQSTGDTRPIVTMEQFLETDSHIEFSDGAAYVPGGFGITSATVNFCYSYYPWYIGVEESYTETTTPLLPVVQGDGPWYGDSQSGAVDYTIRRFAWWALASGCRGLDTTSGPSLAGSTSLWTWQAAAVGNLTTDPNGTWVTSALKSVLTYYTSLPGWYKLIPDTGNVLITGGRGSRTANPPAPSFDTPNYGDTDNYVAGSITPDHSLAVIYCNQFFNITINQAILSPGYTATWVDPLSLATQTATPGPTFNSTPLGNNSAGNPDWVLVLQGAPFTPATVMTQPALPGLTWRRRFQHPQQVAATAAAATSVNAGLASATGTALGQDTGADIASVAPNAGLPTATGAALGQDGGADIASVSANAGLPTATGTALGQDTGADIASVAPNAGLPAATGTSLGQDTGADIAAVTVNAGLASGTGTAFNAGVSIPQAPQQAAYPGQVWREHFQHPQQYAAFTAPPATTNVSAGLAAATGTALGQDTGADIASVAPNSVLAGASSAAQNAGASLADTGGTASATGTGQSPGASVAATPGTGAATGAALNATVLTVVTGPPPMMQIIPGRTWLRQYRHLQQPLPPPPFIPPALQNATSSPTVSPQSGSSAGVTELASVSAGVSGG